MYFKYLFEILIYVCHTLCVFSLLPQSLTIRSGLKTDSRGKNQERRWEKSPGCRPMMLLNHFLFSPVLISKP